VTTKNAINIGFRDVLEVEDYGNSGLICRRFLRVHVELGLRETLVPFLNFSREVRPGTWV
jgi:hypothetical protein